MIYRSPLISSAVSGSVHINSVSNCVWLDPRAAQDPTTGENLPNWFEIEVEMLKKCDGGICYIDKNNMSGYGSTYEMGGMFFLNKPYILINQKEDVYQWSMQTNGAVKCFKTIEESFVWIKKTGWMDLLI